MSALHFDESLVRIFNENALDTYSVEEELAGALCAGGWVKETYANALHEREEAFPTALDAQGINVAIPHCETEHVNQGAVAVGVLKHPVSWRRMDDSSQTCDVSLVVMLLSRRTRTLRCFRRSSQSFKTKSSLERLSPKMNRKRYIGSYRIGCYRSALVISPKASGLLACDRRLLLSDGWAAIRVASAKPA